MSATRAVAITAIGNGLPPAAMLVTQVMLAKSLGVSGRGEVAAATAPLMFTVALLTLGLPEALTHVVARAAGDRFVRQLGISLTALAFSGAFGIVLIAFFAQLLSAGRSEVAKLMVMASAALVPALWTAALRGVAFGAHGWWLVTAERTLSALIQLGAVGGLYISGSLTPKTATLAIAATSFVGAIIYLVAPQWWRLLRSPKNHLAPARSSSYFISYAWRIWLGSTAAIVLSRLDQVMMTPLAGVDELAIYVVAVSVSSAALLFNSSVLPVVFTLESGETSATRVGRAARISTLVTALLGASLCVASLWAIPILFGPEFSPAIPVVVVLLLGIVVSNPGSVAGVSLSASGHPGLRSISLAIAALVNVVTMLSLVPKYGALGAAFATCLGSIVSACLIIYWLHKYCGVAMSEFCGFRAGDVTFLKQLLKQSRNK
jgi:O-antigen/teichoic acid export membrane protein